MTDVTFLHSRAPVLVSLAILLMAGGCFSGGGPVASIESRSADARVRAIVEMAGKFDAPPDEDSIRNLVEALDSDDPAVRFMAIHTLERWTGDTMGYRPADPPWMRDAAIERWVEVVGDGSRAEAMGRATIDPRESALGFKEDR